jgi:hypothetical protein
MAFCPKCKGVMGATAAACPQCGYDFPPDNRTAWPLWVRLGMLDMVWTSRNRATALTLFWLAMAADGALIAAAFWVSDFWGGVLPVSIGAAWCWLAIRWVDNHSAWPEVA